MHCKPHTYFTMQVHKNTYQTEELKLVMVHVCAVCFNAAINMCCCKLVVPLNIILGLTKVFEKRIG